MRVNPLSAMNERYVNQDTKTKKSTKLDEDIIPLTLKIGTKFDYPPDDSTIEITNIYISGSGFRSVKTMIVYQWHKNGRSGHEENSLDSFIKMFSSVTTSMIS